MTLAETPNITTHLTFQAGQANAEAEAPAPIYWAHGVAPGGLSERAASRRLST